VHAGVGADDIVTGPTIEVLNAVEKHAYDSFTLAPRCC